MVLPSSRQTGLARAISKLGYCSRSQAVALIRSGRVRVNGRKISDPEYAVVVGRAVLEVDGERIGAPPKTYLMMNKPRGVVTTAKDEQGRETVYSLLPKSSAWLAPVGRLDKASEGLLLFTNDSEWAARITDPQSHVPKTYHVQIATIADEQLISQLKRGVRDQNESLRIKSVAVLRSGMKNSWLEIVLQEGKNRHIRRMFAALEIEVLRLLRVAIGPLQLGELAKGAVRELENDEVRALTQT